MGARRRILSAAALAVALVASGCASDSDVTSDESPAPAAGSPTDVGDDSTATEEQEPTGDDSPTSLGNAQVGIGARVMSFSPYLVPFEQGWYEDNGLDVELFDAGGGAVAIQAMLSGDVVLGGSGSPEAINAALEHGQSRVVATVAANLGSEVIMSSEMLEEKGVSRDDSLADRVEAMRGARIGITSSGSTTDQLIRFLFSSQGLDANRDAQVVALGGSSEIVSALRGGSVDVVALSPPTGQLLEGEDVGEVLISPPRGDVPGLTGMAFILFSARVSDLEDEAKRAQIVELLRGVAEYQRMLKDDPDEAKKLAREAFPDLDEDVFEAAFEVVSAGIPETPVPREEGIRLVVEFREETLGETIEWTFEDVVDTSVAEEAVAALD